MNSSVLFLTNSYISCIDKLAEHSLGENLDKKTINAFKIVSTENVVLNEALLVSKALNPVVNKILSSEPKIHQISFLANILQTLFAKLPEKTIQNCDFLPKLLLNGDNDTICSFFFDLFKTKDEAKPSTMQFILETIPVEITKAVENASDINTISMAGVYRIFAGLVKFSDVKSKLHETDIAEKLYLSRYPSNSYVLQMYWDSLILFMEEKIYDKFVPLIEKAITSIASANKTFFQYHSSCFRFLTLMCQCQSAFDKYKGISDIIIKVYKEFPNHTIALHSAEKLAVKLTLIPIIGPAEIMNILPVLVENIKNRKSVIIYAWSYKMITDLKPVSPEMTQLITNSLDPAVQEIIEKETEIINTQYGGDVPPQASEPLYDYSASERLSLINFLIRNATNIFRF